MDRRSDEFGAKELKNAETVGHGDAQDRQLKQNYEQESRTKYNTNNAHPDTQVDMRTGAQPKQKASYDKRRSKRCRSAFSAIDW